MRFKTRQRQAQSGFAEVTHHLSTLGRFRQVVPRKMERILNAIQTIFKRRAGIEDNGVLSDLDGSLSFVEKQVKLSALG